MSWDKSFSMTRQYERLPEEGKMSHLTGMEIGIDLLRTASMEDFKGHDAMESKLDNADQDCSMNRIAEKNRMDELQYEIEERLEHLDAEQFPYSKSDMIQLIISIEECKDRFWRGEIGAKQLFRETNAKFDQFKTQYPGFDFLHDPALSAYYSKESDPKTLS
jgi:hypothetical protein